MARPGRDLPDGRVAWERTFGNTITSLEYMAEAGAVAFASSDGRIGLLDVKTGEFLAVASAHPGIGGAVFLNAAIRGPRAAVGTADGRIVIYEYVG